VNLILFETGEIGPLLSRTDPRAVHLLKVLRRKEGDRFDAGIVNGPRGKATLASIAPEGLLLRFEPEVQPEPADAIHLVLALPRPQTARKILSEAASLGVATMRFFQSERGEPGYASSTLWSSGEWRRHLLEGAAQAFDTRLPEVFHDAGLGEALQALPAGCAAIALDNYEAPRRLIPGMASRPLALAFGPERGWSAPERILLRERGVQLAHLGKRVLRTETAVVAALSIVKAVG
jgi:16S rRNA (uracil1498-N3)-methyltransferase